MGQPETITLAVDEDNDGLTPVDYTFLRANSIPNKSSYLKDDATYSMKHLLDFSVTRPKPTASFNGVLRSSAKVTVDVMVAGPTAPLEVKSSLIGEVKFSIPVGATSAQILALRQELVSLLDSDDVMDPLNEMLIY